MRLEVSSLRGRGHWVTPAFEPRRYDAWILAAGMPARVIRPLSDGEIAWKVDGTYTYQDLTRRCLATMVECDPLAAVEPERPRIHMPDVIPLVELKKRGD